MLAVGDKVKVVFSGCKGYGAEKVGQCGMVTVVEPLQELVGMYRVEFPDGVWPYLDREVEKGCLDAKTSEARRVLLSSFFWTISRQLPGRACWRQRGVATRTGGEASPHRTKAPISGAF